MIYIGVIYCATSPSGKKYYGYSTEFNSRKNGHKIASLDKNIKTHSDEIKKIIGEKNTK